MRFLLPKDFLYGIAGFVWIVAGTILCTRAIIWLSQLSFTNELYSESIGLSIAGFGYYFGFSKLVRKNISRISQLTEKASAFAFTPLRGYVMIALMITIGITLRNSSFPKYYLAIPYTAMGGCLLFGSVKYFREFFSFRSQENK